MLTPAGDLTALVSTVSDSPRAKRYLAAFDIGLESVLSGFDAQTGLIHHTVPEGLPDVGPEVAELDRETRKTHISDKNQWAYGVGRSSADSIGIIAYGYSQPLSSYFAREELLLAVIKGFDAFGENQASNGEFVFSPIRFASVYGTHEMAWRLESLLTAYVCVHKSLNDVQRRNIWEILSLAMLYLQKNPCDHPCNRGMSWIAVMAMCWRVRLVKLHFWTMPSRCGGSSVTISLPSPVRSTKAPAHVQATPPFPTSIWCGTGL